MAIACKKDIKIVDSSKDTRTDPPVVASNGIGSCYGNSWQLNEPYYGHHDPVVYNNKLYVPVEDSQRALIYDGSEWTSIPSAVPLLSTTAFTIGNRGYYFENKPDKFWEYNITSNTWTSKTSFPGPSRWGEAFFTIGFKGYLVGGSHADVDGNIPNLDDTWEYNSATNSWSQKASLGHIGRYCPVGFRINDKGYVMGGQVKFPTGYIYLKDLLEFDAVNNT